MMTSPAFLCTPPTSSLNRHPNTALFFNVLSTSTSTSFPGGAPRRAVPSPQVRATGSLSSSSASVAVMSEEEEKAVAAERKIGARVRVTAPLKVYHVPRVSEIDLTGREGLLKQYVGVWKGKKISANLPFKIEFVADVEGRGPVKFFAHLKEDEFEYLD